MKIGVVGSGALGCFYGGRLCQAGYDVHLLLRSDFETIRVGGLRIESPDGNTVLFPRAHELPSSIGECDLVLVGLKTTANNRYGELIRPLLGRDTLILCLQNGLGNCERLGALFGPERVLGGLCFVCLNRTAPGVVCHIAFGRVVMGQLGEKAAEQIRGVAALFKEAGIDCEVVDDLERALWEKLVWNVPFNGLGVAGAAGLAALESGATAWPGSIGDALPTDVLLGDSCWEEWVRGVMEEIIAVANAKGLALDLGLPDKMVANTRAMGEYRASTLIDFQRGQSLELESMFLEPLRQARETPVQIPRLEALCAVLKKLDH